MNFSRGSSGRTSSSKTDGRETALGLEGKRGACLYLVSKDDGVLLGKQELGSPPVIDGMAIADGKVQAHKQQHERAGHVDGEHCWQRGGGLSAKFVRISGPVSPSNQVVMKVLRCMRWLVLAAAAAAAAAAATSTSRRYGDQPLCKDAANT